MFFPNLNSSAIEEVSVNDQIVTVIFKSSGKLYNYEIISEEFTNNLQNTIMKEESIGSFINNAIKNKDIVVMNDLNRDSDVNITTEE